MYKKNIEIIVKVLKHARVPFTPIAIYKKKYGLSYRTFLRGIIKLMKLRILEGNKVGYGRGKGISWIITKNELVEKEKKI